jgi:hypothetical protein
MSEFDTPEVILSDTEAELAKNRAAMAMFAYAVNGASRQGIPEFPADWESGSSEVAQQEAAEFAKRREGHS